MANLNTQSGEFVIYHYTEAGSPEAHQAAVEDGGPWFFEPSSGEHLNFSFHMLGAMSVYSEGYPTAEAALAAAEAWEAQQEAERQGIDADHEAMMADLATPDEGE